MASTTSLVYPAKPLDRNVDAIADDIRTRRALEHLPVLRGYAETRHQAKSWNSERRAFARIEATNAGSTSASSSPASTSARPSGSDDSLYCARGQAENLIKLHKTQLASDRTSCRRRSPTRCASCSTPPPIG